MSEPWAPETVVDEDLAAALIADQFPTLEGALVEPFGVGWDNTVYLVGQAWVFRFPRRSIAVPWIEMETRVLPAIAERLPLGVPVPRWIGQPEPRYDWPFAGYSLVAGTTACRAGLDVTRRGAMAEPLGRFLRALHAIGAEEGTRVGAGPDEIRRSDVAFRAPRAREALGRVAERGLVAEIEPLLEVTEQAAEADPARTLTLLHGDLYARHLIVDDAGALTGVIDWGDAHVGDPAIDLSIAFILLPPHSRAPFLDAYGPVSDDTWTRARFRATYHQANTVLYADDIGDEALRSACILGLEQTAVA